MVAPNDAPQPQFRWVNHVAPYIIIRLHPLEPPLLFGLLWLMSMCRKKINTASYCVVEAISDKLVPPGFILELDIPFSDVLNMHMKWNMLWLFATFTFSPIHTARISIIDSLSNTTFTLHTFHLWDRPDGQSRGLKLGAKKSPLRIYYPAVTCIFLCAANPINTHSPVRNGPDRYPNTTSTLMRILTSHRGGAQGVLRKLHFR